MSWSITLGLYSLRLIDWHPSSLLGSTIFVLTIAAFAFSALLMSPVYGAAIRKVAHVGLMSPNKWQRNPCYVSNETLWLLHGIGFVGLGIYLGQIFILIGGWSSLLATLTSDSHLIRGAEVAPIGIYIAYFGWIAISLTILRWKMRGQISPALLIAVLLQIVGNLLFIDRTRPLWIGFVSILVILPFVRPISFSRFVFGIVAFTAFGALTFYAIALWVGKTGEGLSFYGDVGLGLETVAFYYYVTGGFSYFEALLDSNISIDYVPERTLYPLFKILSIVGLTADPPSQILEFLNVPFPTNVGTFLEPFYSDGGFLYLAMGIVFSSLGIDLLALLMLRCVNPFALFVWANLCFVSFISFFVPKMVSAPIWLFMIMALTSLTLRATLFSPHKSCASPRPESAVSRV